MRWLPPNLLNTESENAKEAEEVSSVKNSEHLRAVPNRKKDLFLFVDEEEGSRLYLKRGSGSSFDVSFMGINHYSYCLRFGSGVIDTVGKNNDGGGRLACVSASDIEGGRGLTIRIDQCADEDQEVSREIMTLFSGMYYFDMESTPLTASSHGDSELLKISIRPWGSEVKQGSVRCVRVHSSPVSPYTKVASQGLSQVCFGVAALKTTRISRCMAPPIVLSFPFSSPRRFHPGSSRLTVLYRPDRDRTANNH